MASQEERDNFFSLVLLLFRVGNQRLREYFKRQWPIVYQRVKPGTVPPPWQDTPHDATEMKKIQPTKLNFSFKAEKKKFDTGNTNIWDLSLLTTVLRYSSLDFVLPFSPEEKALDDLKVIRNTLIGHASDAAIPNAVFNAAWNDACNALTQFNATAADFQSVQDDVKKPLDVLYPMVQQCAVQEIDIQHSVDAITKKVEQLQQTVKQHHEAVEQQHMTLQQTVEQHHEAVEQQYMTLQETVEQHHEAVEQQHTTLQQTVEQQHATQLEVGSRIESKVDLLLEHQRIQGQKRSSAEAQTDERPSRSDIAVPGPSQPSDERPSSSDIAVPGPSQPPERRTKKSRAFYRRSLRLDERPFRSDTAVPGPTYLSGYEKPSKRGKAVPRRSLPLDKGPSTSDIAVPGPSRPLVSGWPTTSSQDIDEESGDVAEITVDEMGCSPNFSSNGAFLYFPPNAVAKRTTVTCTVRSKDYSPSPAGDEEDLVSDIIEFGPCDVDIRQPINVALMHSGPGRDLGYETVVKVFNKDEGVWEEIEELKDDSHLPQDCECDCIQVQISKLTILAVVTRLITDRFQVTPVGCVVRSSACHDVTVEFPEGAVDTTVEGSMKVILMPENNPLTKDACPILNVDGFSNVTFSKYIIIKMPIPNNSKVDTRELRLLRLLDSKREDNEWEDVTSQVQAIVMAAKTSIELSVKRFSCLWPWISSTNSHSAPTIYLYLRFGSPRSVCFAAFKDNEETSPSLSKLTLLCVENNRREWDKTLGNMKGEGYSKLAEATGDRRMRPNDKAYLSVSGADVEPKSVFLQYLKKEVCRKELSVCDTGQGQENVVINFVPNDSDVNQHDPPLLGTLIMIKEKVFVRRQRMGVEDASTFDLTENQRRWLVIGIALNAALLPPLRKFLEPNIENHYTNLKASSHIDKQVYRKPPSHLVGDGSCTALNYRSINNNDKAKKEKDYNYYVTSAVDLGKLYLKPHMAKFTGFDSTCDLSAVLGILSSASVFTADVQDFSSQVRGEVRNEWGHCNFESWDETKFADSFKLMHSLLKAVKLSPDEEKTVADQLTDWENKGVRVCTGGSVPPELVLDIDDKISQLYREFELVLHRNEENVVQLSQDVEDLVLRQKEDIYRVLEALDTVKDAVQSLKQRMGRVEERLGNVEKRAREPVKILFVCSM